MASLLSKVVHSTSLLSLSGLLTKAISFFSVIIITNSLSVADYGALILTLAVTGPVSFISGLGLDTVIVADVSRSLGEKNTARIKRLLVSYGQSKMIIIVALVIFGWFIKPWLVAKFGSAIEIYFWLVSAWVVVQAMNVIAEIILTAHESFKTLAITHVIESLAKFILVVIVWRTVGLSIAMLLVIYATAKFVTLIYNILSLRTVIAYWQNVGPATPGVLWQILRNHGKWEIITQSFISQFMEDGVRPWVIRHFLGLTGLGFISLAGSLYGTLYEFIPIRKVIFPILARLSEEADRAVIIAQKVTKYAFMGYGVVALAAFFAVTPAVDIFFPKYHIAILPFRILLIQFLINAIAMSQPSFLYAHKMQKITALYSLVNVISIMTILPLFLTFFGIIGSFIEKTITMAIGTWLRERLLRRRVGITTWRWRNLFIFDQHDRYVLEKIKNTIRPSA